VQVNTPFFFSCKRFGIMGLEESTQVFCLTHGIRRKGKATVAGEDNGGNGDSRDQGGIRAGWKLRSQGSVRIGADDVQLVAWIRSSRHKVRRFTSPDDEEEQATATTKY